MEKAATNIETATVTLVSRERHARVQRSAPEKVLPNRRGVEICAQGGHCETQSTPSGRARTMISEGHVSHPFFSMIAGCAVRQSAEYITRAVERMKLSWNMTWFSERSSACRRVGGVHLVLANTWFCPAHQTQMNPL